MSITRARISKFKSSYRGRFRPNTDLNLKESVIDRIMTSLYKPHLTYFHKRLLKLVEANMHAQGRQGEPRTFGISYAGRAWFVPWMEGLKETDFSILAVDPSIDETELIKVTANLGEIDVEIYEVRRFLIGLLSFSAPAVIMEERLGRALYGKVKVFLTELEGTGVWNEANHRAFNSYASAHDYLIDAMCQRIMMTMLSAQAFNTAR